MWASELPFQNINTHKDFSERWSGKIKKQVLYPYPNDKISQLKYIYIYTHTVISALLNKFLIFSTPEKSFKPFIMATLIPKYLKPRMFSPESLFKPFPAHGKWPEKWIMGWGKTSCLSDTSVKIRSRRALFLFDSFIHFHSFFIFIFHFWELYFSLLARKSFSSMENEAPQHPES